MPEGKGTFAMNGRLYDFLRNAVQIYLPALATLYFSLGGIWGWPNVEQIIGTITAVTVFLGVCLKISKTSYENSGKSTDGVVTVDGDGLKNLKIPLTKEEVAGKKVLKLEVKEEPDLPLS